MRRTHHLDRNQVAVSRQQVGSQSQPVSTAHVQQLEKPRLQICRRPRRLGRSTQFLFSVESAAADARPSRWTGGEKVDVGIKDLQYDKRKVTLSIKFLEETLKNEALKKYGSDGDFSGKNLPFSTSEDLKNLSKDLKKKEKDK